MASKRRLRRKSCGTKKRFATQDEAVAGLVRVVKAGNAGTGYLVPYHCRFCGGYHFGHRATAPG